MLVTKICVHLFELTIVDETVAVVVSCLDGTNGRPRVNCLDGFSTKTSDPSKAQASQDNVHLVASLLSVETAGISSRQHIMYMYTCRRLTGTSIDSK